MEELKKRHIDCTHMFEPVGCKHCGQTGYFGRTAICDALVVDDQLKADIANNKGIVTQLRTEGKRTDRTNLRKEGLKRVALGITSLEELKRTVG
jgi:general secretion pathway protein E